VLAGARESPRLPRIEKDEESIRQDHDSNNLFFILAGPVSVAGTQRGPDVGLQGGETSELTLENERVTGDHRSRSRGISLDDVSDDIALDELALLASGPRSAAAARRRDLLTCERSHIIE
jgi:hypothetical protein